MYAKDRVFTLTEGHSKMNGAEAEVVVVYADIRDFSNWSLSETPKIVARLLKAVYEQVIQICNDCHPIFHKFLGDGFLLLWERDAEFTSDVCLRHALDAAFAIHKAFFYAAREFPNPPKGMGIGISVGGAVRIQAETFLEEMNEVDFLGYPMNCGARMQSLSPPYGTTLCSSCVEVIKKDPEHFLYPNTPGFRRLLHPATDKTLQKTAEMKGLRTGDRTGLAHLTWPDAPFPTGL